MNVNEKSVYLHGSRLPLSCCDALQIPLGELQLNAKAKKASERCEELVVGGGGGAHLLTHLTSTSDKN